MNRSASTSTSLSREPKAEARVASLQDGASWRPVIGLGLFGMQVVTGGKRLFRVEEALAVGVGLLATLLALEHVQVEPVHRQQVVEGGLDRREKTAAGGDEFVLGQLQAGLVQTVVGPAIVVGLGQQMMRQRLHGSAPFQAKRCSCISRSRLRVRWYGNARYP